MILFWASFLLLFATVIHVQSKSTSSQTIVHSTGNASPNEVIPDLNIPLEEPSIQSNLLPHTKETKHRKMLKKLKDKGVLADYRRESRIRLKKYRSNLTVEERKAISYRKNKAEKQRLLASPSLLKKHNQRSKEAMQRYRARKKAKQNNLPIKPEDELRLPKQDHIE